MYIPDLTERFPEGFGGVDLTDKYFPSRNYDPFDDWFEYEDDLAEYELTESED